MSRRRRKPIDRSNPAVVGAARKLEAEVADEREATLVALMQDVRFRDAIRWIQHDVCRIHRNPHRPGSPGDTSFNLGLQAVARQIDEELQRLAPDSWLQMQGEHLRALAAEEITQERVQARQEQSA